MQEEQQEEPELESSSTRQEPVSTQVEPAEMQVGPSDKHEEEMPTVSTPNQATETQFSYMAQYLGYPLCQVEQRSLLSVKQ